MFWFFEFYVFFCVFYVFDNKKKMRIEYIFPILLIFEIDKEYLRTEAKSVKHVEKSKWFFSTLTNEQKENLNNNGIKQWKQWK